MINTNTHKYQLCAAISQKLEHKIDERHIMNIIAILLEEIMKDILKKGKFFIGNFGRFILERMSPRKYFNFQTGRVEQSVGNNILRFKLTKKLKRKILDNIDIARTFKDG